MRTDGYIFINKNYLSLLFEIIEEEEEKARAK
jgi:hypothetical protein